MIFPFGRAAKLGRRAEVVVGADRGDAPTRDQLLGVFAANLRCLTAGAAFRTQLGGGFFPFLTALLFGVFFCLALSTIGLLFEVTLPGVSGDRVRQHRAHDAAIHDLIDQLIGHPVRQHLGMLNEIETGFDRQPETLGARRVRLGNQTALLGLFHHYSLCPRREPDHDRVREVARAAVLDEVGPQIQILVDGDP